MDYRYTCGIVAGLARRGGNPAAWLLAAVVLALLPGCRRLEPSESQPAVAAPTAEAPAKAELWSEDPLFVDKVMPEADAGVEARSPQPVHTAATAAEEPVSQYPANLIKGVEDPEAKVKVVLNFDALQITQLVEAFAQLLKFSYLIDPAIANKGAVTINVGSEEKPEEMTAREAWETFEHILWLSGAYASRNPGFIHILPFERMPKERRLLFKNDIMANVEVALIPIRFRKSADISGLIEPFKTDGATIKDLVDSNTLLIVEAPANMPKMRELIRELDNRGEASWPHVCLPCRNVAAEDLQADLETILPTLGFTVTTKSPSNGAIKLAALPRLQLIVASAALQEVLDQVEYWVKALDVADTMEKENVYWYNVKHSTADQLKEALEVFFNTQATTGTRPSRTKGTSSKAKATRGSRRDTTTRTETPAENTANAPAKAAASTTRKPKEETEGGTVFDTPVVILVDEVRERLTIRTTPRAYALVEAILTRQDVAPRQVSIQAMIADITLTKSTEFGFTYAAKKFISHNGDTVSMISAGAGAVPTTSTGTGTGTSTVSTPSLGDAPFALLFRDHTGDPLVFIRAVAGEGNTRILSEPQVVVLSGEEAQINVGEKVPVPTESLNYADDANNFRTNYEYEDTGVIMEVKPNVTAGNDVRLEIRQEVSDAAESTDPTIPPRISNKVIESVLSVADGATVMMGGLIRSKRSDSNSGWPLLKDIPYLGVLFRSNETHNDRSELLILLKVNVISNDSQMENLLGRYRAALAQIEAQGSMKAP
jgi:general secretion pathway protein D